MRYALLTLLILSSGQTLAQDRRDPTLPRATLKPVPAATVSSEQPAMPDLRLKAIVMQDTDHASAIILAADRKVLLKLARGVQTQFTIKGIQFEVIDFDARSIRVKCAQGELLVN